MLANIDKCLAICSKWSLAAGGILTLTIAVVGTLDTILAATVNYPLPAAHTFAEETLPAAVLLSTGYALRSNANIIVDIVTNKMGSGLRRLVMIHAAGTTALFFGGFTYGAWKLAIESVQLREVAVAAVEFSVWPLKLCFAIGATIALFETISLVVKSLLGEISMGHSELSEVSEIEEKL